MLVDEMIEIMGIVPKNAGPGNNTLYIDERIYDPDDFRKTHKLNIAFNGINNIVHLNGSLRIDGVLYIYFNGRDNLTRLGSNGYVGADTTIMFYQAGPGTECYNCNVILGDRLKLNGAGIMIEAGEPNTPVHIGDDLLAASGVRIITRAVPGQVATAKSFS